MEKINLFEARIEKQLYGDEKHTESTTEVVTENTPSVHGPPSPP